MAEGGIADDRDRMFMRFGVGFVEPDRHADTRAHAHDRVHGGKRRHRAERIAADIAEHVEFEFGQNVEHAAVRAARTEHGRARGHFRRLVSDLFPEHALADERRGKFAVEREKVLALHFDPVRLDERFDVRRKFFRNDTAFDALSEFFDQFIRERITHAEF